MELYSDIPQELVETKTELKGESILDIHSSGEQEMTPYKC